MARREIVELLDDIDNTPATETVSFGMDGTMYEIDLNTKHATKLRDALAPFVGAGRKARLNGTVPRARTYNPATVDREQNRAIRRWWGRNAKAAALPPVTSRGRIPGQVAEAYQRAGGRDVTKAAKATVTAITPHFQPAESHVEAPTGAGEGKTTGRRAPGVRKATKALERAAGVKAGE